MQVKVRGHRELVTVVGKTPSIQAGEPIQSSGRWITHRDHGRQFQAELLQTAPPSSLEGIEKYLGSGLIKGIGPYFARKLVKAFGEKVFDVIEKEPDRLRDLEGIGPKRVQRIVTSWDDQKAIREIIVFLQSHGVGTSRAVRIYKTYGADAIPLVSENPYRLARDIRGIGFRTADQIAESLGISRTSMMRARAGIAHTLTEAVSQGHCGLPEDELLPLEEELLNLPRETLAEALQLELQEVTISFEGRLVSYDFGELDEVVLAYATSIHKSQGSEYPAVVIPVLTRHYPMLRRNLLYTDITQGRRLVVLVGQRKAIGIAVRDRKAQYPSFLTLFVLSNLATNPKIA